MFAFLHGCVYFHCCFPGSAEDSAGDLPKKTSRTGSFAISSPETRFFKAAEISPKPIKSVQTPPKSPKIEKSVKKVFEKSLLESLRGAKNIDIDDLLEAPPAFSKSEENLDKSLDSDCLTKSSTIFSQEKESLQPDALKADFHSDHSKETSSVLSDESTDFVGKEITTSKKPSLILPRSFLQNLTPLALLTFTTMELLATRSRGFWGKRKSCGRIPVFEKQNLKLLYMPALVLESMNSFRQMLIKRCAFAPAFLPFLINVYDEFNETPQDPLNRKVQKVMNKYFTDENLVYSFFLIGLALSNPLYAKPLGFQSEEFDASGHLMLQYLVAGLVAKSVHTLSEKRPNLANAYEILYLFSDTIFIGKTIMDCHTPFESLMGYFWGKTIAITASGSSWLYQKTIKRLFH